MTLKLIREKVKFRLKRILTILITFKMIKANKK